MALRWRHIHIQVGVDTHARDNARVWAWANMRAHFDHGRGGTTLVVFKTSDGKYLKDRPAFEELVVEARKLGAEVYHVDYRPLLPPKPKPTTSAPKGRRRRRAVVRKQERNVLRPPAPRYCIDLTLGDLDALFEPIGDGDPWTEKGVQQRLQVLGYLYTPLGHRHVDTHARACWDYYKRVHGSDSDAAAKQTLTAEIRGNIVAASHPASGVVLDASTLPSPGEFAALRVPGGYAATQHPGSGLRAGDHFFRASVTDPAVDAKYDFKIGYRRDDIEKLLVEECVLEPGKLPLLGQVPILARVTLHYEDGRILPVADAPVLFRLVDPDAHGNHPTFGAPPMPDKVMNYDIDGVWWAEDVYPPDAQRNQGLVEDEWRATRLLARKAYDADPDTTQTTAEDWVDAWLESPAIPWDAVSNWWGDQIDEVAGGGYGRLDDPKSLREELDDTIDAILAMVRPDPESPAKASKPQFSFGANGKAAWKRIWRLTVMALNGGGDPKARALGWIDDWDQGGDERGPVDAWWGPDDVVELSSFGGGPMGAKIDHFRGAVDEILGKFELDPMVPKQAPGTVKLRGDNWGWTWRCVVTAKLVGGADHEIKQRATTWMTTWLDAHVVTWPQISNWWTAEVDRPYPTLRNNMMANAKRAVEYLLSDREKGETRVAEKTGVGQRRYIAAVLADSFAGAAVDDPQRNNAPAARGGKLGLTIDKLLDAPGEAQPGFHSPRDEPRIDTGDLAIAALPGDTVTHPHAMQASTNAKGYAGVIFTPSRIGGDAYKLRAYIDPEWLATKPRAPEAHRDNVETGTMVVWRNLRIHRYIQMRNPLVEYSDTVRAVLDRGLYPPNHASFLTMGLDTDVLDLALLPGVATEARAYDPVPPGPLVSSSDRALRSMYRPLQVQAPSLETQLKWGYCELLADCDGKEVLGEDLHRNAIAAGRAALERKWTYAKDVHWDSLFVFDRSSPFLVTMRCFAHYNEVLRSDPGRAAIPELDPESEADKRAFTTAMHAFYEGMMEYLCGGGVLPGLVIVQVPRADSWDYRAGAALGGSTITSGYGTGGRGAYVSHTSGVYHGVFRIYPNTSNALHEIGHVLGLAHQPPAGADLVAAHEKPVLEPFVTPADDETVCVMSYSGCYGDYCGECILSLRGWKQLQEDDHITALHQA